MYIFAILLVPFAYFIMFGCLIRTIFWPIESVQLTVSQLPRPKAQIATELFVVLTGVGLILLVCFIILQNAIIAYLPAAAALLTALIFAWLYFSDLLWKKGIENLYARLIILLVVAPFAIIVSAGAIPWLIYSSSLINGALRLTAICVTMIVLRWCCKACVFYGTHTV